MHKYRRPSCALALALLCLVPLTVHAQESRGTLIGKITDPSGALVAGASVEAVNVASGVTVAARSNNEGNYRLPFLTVGEYRVTFTMSGFQKMVREKVEIRVADVRMLDVTLQLGGTSESVTVSAEAAALDTATASLGQVVDRQRLDQLPFREGNPHEMVKMAPGIVTSTHLRLAKPGMTGGLSLVSVDGGTQARNDFALDGVVNTAGTNVAYSPPAASVEEVKVQTANYDSSIGFTGGGVVNVVTRSGGNQFHGEAAYWMRNSRFDSKDYFQSLNKREKSKYDDDRYDFAVGGPILRDRLHFHTSAEFNPYTLPFSSINSYPTMKMRTGDLSELNYLGQIYDPMSGRVDPTNPGRVIRDPLPGNIVPASRINATSAQLVKFFPEPNLAGVSNNFLHPNPVETQDWKTVNTRVDYALSDRHRMYGRYSWANWIYKDPDFHLNGLSSGNSIDRTDHLLSIDDTFIASPNMVVNARFGYTAQRDIAESFSAGIDLAKYGLTAFGDLIPEGAAKVLPDVNIAGWTTGYRSRIGEGENYNRLDRIYSGQFSVHYMRGNHTLAFGGEHRHYVADQLNVAVPTLDFGSNWGKGPYNTSASAGQLHGLAAFLMGFPGSGGMTIQPRPRTSTPRSGMYIQDDWRITPRLMLNFGLRYELDFPTTEASNAVVNGLDLATTLPVEAAVRAAYANDPIPQVAVNSLRVRGGMLYAGANGRSSGLWDIRRTNFMPRAGATFQLDSKTVLMGGFGRFYDTLGITRTAVNSYQTGFSQSTWMQTSYDAVLPRTDMLTKPYPNGLLQPQGNSAGIMTSFGSSISAPYASGVKTPYTDRFSFGIRRQLPGRFVVESTYLGNRGHNLIVSHDLDAIPIQYYSMSKIYDQPAIDVITANVTNPFYGIAPTGTSLGGSTRIQRANLLRPYPGYTGITVQETSGRNWYDAWQTRIERRMSNGFTVNVAYTLSKALAAVRYREQNEPAPEKTFFQFDRTHVLNVNGIAEVPFGRGRRWGRDWSRPLDAVLGGWRFSAMYKIETGTPIGMPNYVLNDGVTLAGMKLPAGQQTWDKVFDTSIFNRAAGVQPSYNVRYYSSYVGNVRCNDIDLLDVQLMKNLAITEGISVELRAGAYNSLNAANLMGLNTTPTSSSFGRYGSVNGYARNYQFGVKASF